MHEHVVMPHVVRETEVEAAPLVRDESVAPSDLSLDIGQNLSLLVVKAQRTRRAGESLTVKVREQIVDGRIPGAAQAPNCLADSNDSRVRSAVEGNLRLHTPG
jgi:hypothetical protein